MNHFRRLKGDCQICNGARRDCRQNTQNSIIHCRDTEAQPIGFRFLGEDAQGFFMWIEFSLAEDQNWQDKLEAQRKQQQEKHQRKLKRLLPIEERDRQFKAIARHCGLSLNHRAKLEQRGLSPELVEQAYLRSVLWTWQNSASIPGATRDLPGVDGRGRLRRYPESFAVAVPNEHEEILGAQLRLDLPGDDDAKYLWLSSESISGNGIYLPTGEVPIGFYRPFGAVERAEINVAEGFLKPLIAAQRFGVVCLGAVGANFVSSPELFKHYLKVASAELQTKLLVLNADAGSVSNPHVMGAYRRFWKKAASWGYTVRVRWWNQVEKAAGDIDEIDTATFETAELLTVDQFEAIAQPHFPQPSVPEGFQPPVETKKQERDRLIQKRKMRFRSDHWEMVKRDFLLTPTEGRSIKYYEGFCKQFGLQMPTVLLRGWLGAGKTEAMLRSLIQRREYLSKQILWVVPRNGLSRQTAARAEKLGFPEIRHVQDANSENRDKLRRGEPGLYLLCPDSLKDYAVGEVSWSDTIVILDEFAGMRSEVLDKSVIMPQFERLISECWRLVAIDAFLSDADARILSRYRKGQRLILDQQFKKSTKPVFWLEQINKDGVISLRHDGIAFALIDQWAKEGVKSVVIASDNLTALKAVVERMQFHGMTVHLCSSETPEENALFMPDPDGHLARLNIYSAAYSPTAQSGLDMQKHYEKGLLICSGVLPPLQMLQMLGRARQCDEWYVSAPRFAQDSPLSIRALDGDRVKGWGDRLKSAFENVGVQHSDRSHGWGVWQSAVDEVCRAFNSECIQSLLEYFFERVEVLEIRDAPAQEWQEAIDRIKREDARKLIRADLARGQELLKAQKAPMLNAEVWDVRLGQLHEKYPQAIENLIKMANDDSTNNEEQLIDLMRVFKSSRMDRLKFWVMATEPNQDDDAALMAMLRDRFTCAKSAKLKAFRHILLFRSLKLEVLANCVSADQNAVVDQTHYHAQSQFVRQLYQNFLRSEQLQQLFPQVEDVFSFWAIVRQCMRFMGYQSCAKSVRQSCDEMVANGYYRNGRRRFSQSKVIYMNGWLQMECSGNLLFQAIFWSDVIPAIRNRLFLERSRRENQNVSPPNELIAA